MKDFMLIALQIEMALEKTLMGAMITVTLFLSNDDFGVNNFKQRKSFQKAKKYPHIKRMEILFLSLIFKNEYEYLIEEQTLRNYAKSSK